MQARSFLPVTAKLHTYVMPAAVIGVTIRPAIEGNLVTLILEATPSPLDPALLFIGLPDPLRAMPEDDEDEDEDADEDEDEEGDEDEDEEADEDEDEDEEDDEED